MSYLEYRVQSVPTGWRKLLHLHWPMILVISAIASIGFLMLYSVAGGSFEPWAEIQIERFLMGLVLMFIIAMVPIWFWRNMSFLAFGLSMVLLVVVEFYGITRNGSTRWIDLGFMLFQPSEMAKISLVMLLAAYYDALPSKRLSRPLWVLLPIIITMLPAALVLNQPDLGTALLLIFTGGAVVFAAGVHWGYFATVVAAGTGLIVAVFQSKGTSWQILLDYHYRRIDVLLDPASDPLGDGYHVTQSKIALGSGGWTGRGYMQGTQTRLNFLPEQQTDFIFTTLAEEFGFLGGSALLLLYVLLMIFCISAALRMKDQFSSLLVIGISVTFFLAYAVNLFMVMGMAPVVGVPLPLVSYGGTSMLVLMAAFGLIQSAHVHRPRER